MSDQLTVLYQSRYCDQKEFSVGVFSNNIWSEDDNPFLSNNFGLEVFLDRSRREFVTNNNPFLLNIFELPSIPKWKHGCKVVTSGSDRYVSGRCFECRNSLSIVKYSSFAKTWNTLPQLKEVI